MASYKEITLWIKDNYGFTVRTCWIAHVKELCGMNQRIATNRKDPNIREDPCPKSKIEVIKQAFRHFEMI